MNYNIINCMAYVQKTLQIDGNLSRNEQRKAVINEFLNESPGTGKGNKVSRYSYLVENLVAGNRIFLTRPAPYYKGFDFEIHVEKMKFSAGTDRPGLKDILADLAQKKQAAFDNYQILLQAILDVYNCNDPNDVLKRINMPSFNVGFDVDLILKVIKWFFIEQDIRFWNFSGRMMFKSAIQKI